MDTRYKTFWRRAGAAGADELAVAPVTTAWLIVVSIAVAPISDRVALGLSLLGGGTALIYSIYCHARWGQTVGKMACGVRVVDARDEDRTITLAQAIVREVPNVVLWLTLISALIGVLATHGTDLIVFDEEDNTWDFQSGPLVLLGTLVAIQLAWLVLEALTMAFNRRRRSIHDFLAGTVVVKTGYVDQPWPKVFDDRIVYPTSPAQSAELETPAFAPTLPRVETHPRYRIAWDRFWAAVIDNLVFFVPVSAVALPISIAADSTAVSSALAATTTAGYAIYDVLLHGNGGKTVGKMALGITVVDAGSLGPITWRQAWLRSSGLWLAVAGQLAAALAIFSFGFAENQTASKWTVSGTVDGWAVVSLICMLVTPQRRALHDLVAGTTVVKDQLTFAATAPMPPSAVGVMQAQPVPPRPPGW